MLYTLRCGSRGRMLLAASIWAIGGLSVICWADEVGESAGGFSLKEIERQVIARSGAQGRPFGSGRGRGASLPGKGRYIVELDEKPGRSKSLPAPAIQAQRTLFRGAVEDMEGRVVHNYGKWKNRIVVEIAEGKQERLRRLPRFKSLRPDLRVHALLEDSAYQIYADYAWNNGVTGQGVVVAVVDTGIDYNHPDLQDKVIAQHNFVTDTSDAMDDHGHGTHCAGIIASEGMQYRGVSHDVALMAAKVLNSQGSGYSSDVALGIDWCVAQGADIISLSLGEGLYSGACDTSVLGEAANDAVAAGVLVVCASGNNSNHNAMVSPACASQVIAVGSVDKTDAVASYSNGAAGLDIVAPGGYTAGGTNYPEIVSTFSPEVANNPAYCFLWDNGVCFDDISVVDGDRYIRAIGTSMATPHVAAAAALLLQENPDLTPAELQDVLEQNADDLGTAGWDNRYGWGRVNVQRALDNVPRPYLDLVVNITEPNSFDPLLAEQNFGLSADVECFREGGCGEVMVVAQFCSGRDCNDFVDVNAGTLLATEDANPTVGVAHWEVRPDAGGEFKVRVVATSNLGIDGDLDSIIVSVYDPNQPIINSVDCQIDSVWQDCSAAGYGDVIQKIRVDAYDPEEVPTVHLEVENIPDNQILIDGEASYGAGYFTYEANLQIAESGEWEITAQCLDSEGKSDTATVSWNVAWGSLLSYLVDPCSSATVAKGDAVVMTVGSECNGGECSDVELSLRLNESSELAYDDGTAEDYGDIGSTDGYIAVRLTPNEYPAQVNAARFFIWDETTYPFELHVWDDDGLDVWWEPGAPGTELMTPRTVDPVVPSVPEVAWFDIDLTSENILIESGSFYIGWRQLVGVNNNQVGFDTNGERHHRSWGHLAGSWFNLEDFLIDGNIMIRATVSEPGQFGGLLPDRAGMGPFYVSSEHPWPCAGMDGAETCEETFSVHAVGAVDESVWLHAYSHNNFALDQSNSIRLTVGEPQNPCGAANLDAINSVDMSDYALLAGEWGQGSAPLGADINGDQMVDLLDLAMMAILWLDECN